jgi:hypothetical protein
MLRPWKRKKNNKMSRLQGNTKHKLKLANTYAEREQPARYFVFFLRDFDSLSPCNLFYSFLFIIINCKINMVHSVIFIISNFCC